MVNMNPIIKVKRNHKDAIVPTKGSALSSGFDLYALDVVSPTHHLYNLKTPLGKGLKRYHLQSRERVLVRTGLSVELPKFMELQVRPRSGLALKNGITVLNSPGTVDNDYRGDVGVVLINMGDEPFVIEAGDRIAQAVFMYVPLEATLVEVEETSETERGVGGYGSTGV